MAERIMLESPMKTSPRPGLKTESVRYTLRSILGRHAPWVAALAVPSLAVGGPTGEDVVRGAADVGRPDALTTVIDQFTEQVAINWQSFNVGGQEYVIFNQPSSSSIALNRVVGGAPSVILGTIQANGQVFLVNGQGITFGEGAVIDAQGFVASTLDISDDDFMAGDFSFAKSSGAPDAEIRNFGTIQAAADGYVVLAGDYVENSGIIVANAGHVILGAGSAITLDIAGDGLTSFVVDEATLAGLAGVRNVGQILANGSMVIMTAEVANSLVATAVNQEGLIQAHSVEEHQGIIYLAAEGGDIEMSGRLVADGVDGADGGVVVLRSGGDLDFTGSISAAGDEGAEGGFVELSADGGLAIRGAVDTGGGQLLIDPVTLTLENGTNTGSSSTGAAAVGVDFVEGQLNAGTNVSLIASGSINASSLVTDITAIGTGDLAFKIGTVGSGGSLFGGANCSAFGVCSEGSGSYGFSPTTGGAINLPNVSISVGGSLSFSASYGFVNASALNATGNININAGAAVIGSTGGESGVSASISFGTAHGTPMVAFGTQDHFTFNGGTINAGGHLNANIVSNATGDFAGIFAAGPINAGGDVNITATNMTPYGGAGVFVFDQIDESSFFGSTTGSMPVWQETESSDAATIVAGGNVNISANGASSAEIVTGQLSAPSGGINVTANASAFGTAYAGAVLLNTASFEETFWGGISSSPSYGSGGGTENFAGATAGSGVSLTAIASASNSFAEVLTGAIGAGGPVSLSAQANGAEVLAVSTLTETFQFSPGSFSESVSNVGAGLNAGAGITVLGSAGISGGALVVTGDLANSSSGDIVVQANGSFGTVEVGAVSQAGLSGSISISAPSGVVVNGGITNAGSAISDHIGVSGGSGGIRIDAGISAAGGDVVLTANDGGIVVGTMASGSAEGVGFFSFNGAPVTTQNGNVWISSYGSMGELGVSVATGAISAGGDVNIIADNIFGSAIVAILDSFSETSTGEGGSQSWTSDGATITAGGGIGIMAFAEGSAEVLTGGLSAGSDVHLMAQGFSAEVSVIGTGSGSEVSFGEGFSETVSGGNIVAGGSVIAEGFGFEAEIMTGAINAGSNAELIANGSYGAGIVVADSLFETQGTAGFSFSTTGASITAGSNIAVVAFAEGPAGTEVLTGGMSAGNDVIVISGAGGLAVGSLAQTGATGPSGLTFLGADITASGDVGLHVTASGFGEGFGTMDGWMLTGGVSAGGSVNMSASNSFGQAVIFAGDLSFGGGSPSPDGDIVGATGVSVVAEGAFTVAFTGGLRADSGQARIEADQVFVNGDIEAASFASVAAAEGFVFGGNTISASSGSVVVAANFFEHSGQLDVFAGDGAIQWQPDIGSSESAHVGGVSMIAADGLFVDFDINVAASGSRADIALRADDDLDGFGELLIRPNDGEGFIVTDGGGILLQGAGVNLDGSYGNTLIEVRADAFGGGTASPGFLGADADGDVTIQSPFGGIDIKAGDASAFANGGSSSDDVSISLHAGNDMSLSAGYGLDLRAGHAQATASYGATAFADAGVSLVAGGSMTITAGSGDIDILGGEASADASGESGSQVNVATANAGVLISAGGPVNFSASSGEGSIVIRGMDPGDSYGGKALADASGLGSNSAVAWTGVDVRAGGDLSLTAGSHVNLWAGSDVTNDTIFTFLAEATGSGVKAVADRSLDISAGGDIFVSAGGSVEVFGGWRARADATDSGSATALGSVTIQASGAMDFQLGGQLYLTGVSGDAFADGENANAASATVDNSVAVTAGSGGIFIAANSYYQSAGWDAVAKASDSATAFVDGSTRLETTGDIVMDLANGFSIYAASGTASANAVDKAGSATATVNVSGSVIAGGMLSIDAGADSFWMSGSCCANARAYGGGFAMVDASRLVSAETGIFVTADSFYMSAAWSDSAYATGSATAIVNADGVLQTPGNITITTGSSEGGEGFIYIYGGSGHATADNPTGTGVNAEVHAGNTIEAGGDLSIDVFFGHMSAAAGGWSQVDASESGATASVDVSASIAASGDVFIRTQSASFAAWGRENAATASEGGIALIDSSLTVSAGGNLMVSAATSYIDMYAGGDSGSAYGAHVTNGGLASINNDIMLTATGDVLIAAGSDIFAGSSANAGGGRASVVTGGAAVNNGNLVVSAGGQLSILAGSGFSITGVSNGQASAYGSGNATVSNTMTFNAGSAGILISAGTDFRTSPGWNTRAFATSVSTGEGTILSGASATADASITITTPGSISIQTTGGSGSFEMWGASGSATAIGDATAMAFAGNTLHAGGDISITALSSYLAIAAGSDAQARASGDGATATVDVATVVSASGDIFIQGGSVSFGAWAQSNLAQASGGGEATVDAAVLVQTPGNLTVTATTDYIGLDGDGNRSSYGARVDSGGTAVLDNGIHLAASGDIFLSAATSVGVWGGGQENVATASGSGTAHNDVSVDVMAGGALTLLAGSSFTISGAYGGSASATGDGTAVLDQSVLFTAVGDALISAGINIEAYGGSGNQARAFDDGAATLDASISLSAGGDLDITAQSVTVEGGDDLLAEAGTGIGSYGNFGSGGGDGSATVSATASLSAGASLNILASGDVLIRAGVVDASAAGWGDAGVFAGGTGSATATGDASALVSAPVVNITAGDVVVTGLPFAGTGSPSPLVAIGIDLPGFAFDEGNNTAVSNNSAVISGGTVSVTATGSITLTGLQASSTDVVTSFGSPPVVYSGAAVDAPAMITGSNVTLFAGSSVDANEGTLSASSTMDLGASGSVILGAVTTGSLLTVRTDDLVAGSLFSFSASADATVQFTGINTSDAVGFDGTSAGTTADINYVLADLDLFTGVDYLVGGGTNTGGVLVADGGSFDAGVRTITVQSGVSVAGSNAISGTALTFGAGTAGTVDVAVGDGSYTLASAATAVIDATGAASASLTLGGSTVGDVGASFGDVGTVTGNGAGDLAASAAGLLSATGLSVGGSGAFSGATVDLDTVEVGADLSAQASGTLTVTDVSAGGAGSFSGSTVIADGALSAGDGATLTGDEVRLVGTGETYDVTTVTTDLVIGGVAAVTVDNTSVTDPTVFSFTDGFGSAALNFGGDATLVSSANGSALAIVGSGDLDVSGQSIGMDSLVSFTAVGDILVSEVAMEAPEVTMVAGGSILNGGAVGSITAGALGLVAGDSIILDETILNIGSGTILDFGGDATVIGVLTDAGVEPTSSSPNATLIAGNQIILGPVSMTGDYLYLQTDDLEFSDTVTVPTGAAVQLTPFTEGASFGLEDALANLQNVNYGNSTHLSQWAGITVILGNSAHLGDFAAGVNGQVDIGDKNLLVATLGAIEGLDSIISTGLVGTLEGGLARIEFFEPTTDEIDPGSSNNLDSDQGELEPDEDEEDEDTGDDGEGVEGEDEDPPGSIRHRTSDDPGLVCE